MTHDEDEEDHDDDHDVDDGHDDLNDDDHDDTFDHKVKGSIQASCTLFLCPMSTTMMVMMIFVVKIMNYRLKGRL